MAGLEVLLPNNVTSHLFNFARWIQRGRVVKLKFVMVGLHVLGIK